MSRRVFGMALGLVLVATLSVRAGDWPHWRGADRTDVVDEDSGWDAGAWPPVEKWSANVGEGTTSPLVVGDRVYTLGWRDGRDTVVALDLNTGTVAWSQSYAAPQYARNSTGDQSMYSGVTPTPSFDVETGVLYTMNTDGELIAWDTKRDGARVWGLNLYERYHQPMRPKVGSSGRRDYGYTSAPLVYGRWIVVEVGSPDGTVMAFDKRTGDRVWASQYTGVAGHSGGLVPMTVEGVPCLAVLTVDGLLVLRVDAGNEGKTVATYPWLTEFANNNMTPAVIGSDVLISSGYNHQRMVRLHVTLGEARSVWAITEFTKTCSPVVYKGSVYWSFKGLRCVDAASGKVRWEGGKFGDVGSCVVTRDGRVIVWANDGDLALAESNEGTHGGLKILSTKNNVFRAYAWPHVVLAHGRLICKDGQGNVKCFDLRERGGEVNVARGASRTPDLAAAPTGDDARLAALTEWPGADTPGLVLAWKAGYGARRVDGAVAKGDARWRMVERGKASRDERGRMSLAGGAYVADAADRAIVDACRETNQLSIEAVIAPDSLKQSGPARIVSLSSDAYHRDFTLGQEGGKLVMRLRTTRTGDNGSKPEVTLCDLQTGKPQHVIVSYAAGRLTCYLNGKLVIETDAVRGDLSNWDADQHFVLGDEWNGERDWAGVIERVAIYNRAVGPLEAAARFALATVGR